MPLLVPGMASEVGGVLDTLHPMIYHKKCCKTSFILKQLKSKFVGVARKEYHLPRGYEQYHKWEIQ